jgi:RNAse (barnase) inhibitor barstar
MVLTDIDDEDNDVDPDITETLWTTVIHKIDVPIEIHFQNSKRTIRKSIANYIIFSKNAISQSD